MSFKIFQTNTALTAEDLNDVLMEQVVMRFTDATERNNAIPAPDAGMHCHLLSTNRTYFYDGSSWIELMPGTVSGLTARTLLVCTSTTRPSHAAGRLIFETDTSALYVSNGTSWTVVGSGDTGWVNFASSAVSTGWSLATLTGGAQSAYRVKGGTLFVRVGLTRTGANITADSVGNVTDTEILNGTVTALQVGYPAYFTGAGPTGVDTVGLRLDTSGKVWLTDLGGSSNAISTGDGLTFTFSVAAN